MSLSDWIHLIACVGHLALCFLVLLRGARNQLALPLGLLCLDLFVWNFAGWAHGMYRAPIWRTVDLTFSPFTAPLWLHFVVAFVGRLRPLRWMLVGFYAGFGLLSMWSLAAPFVPLLNYYQHHVFWSVAYLAGLAPVMVVSVVLLVRHLRRSASLVEQMRTRLVIAAGAISGIIGASDLWDQWLISAKTVSVLGVLAATLILAAVVFRFRLFGRALSTSVAMYAGGLGVIGVAGYLAVFQVVGPNMALLVIGIVTVTVLLVIVTRNLITSFAESKSRLEQMAAYGRFSAQMAHDLKNPLAALKGALQFLVEERDQGRLVGDEGGLLGLSVAQVERIEAVIEKYRRLSEVHPAPVPLQVNDVARAVLALSAFAQHEAGGRIEVRRSLAEDLPECPADRELLSSALENLVRNAFEAMPEGGVVTVSTALSNAGPAAVSITVEDTGEGMDARQQERACDDFYTTKATGSGLGLAFVRRVAEAHGGSLQLTSVLGQGTAVEVRLPMESPLPQGEQT